MGEAPRLGTLLLQQGLVTEQQLEEGLRVNKQTGKPLGRVLVEQGMITDGQLVAMLATQLGLEYVNLDEVQVDPTVAVSIPTALARRHCAIPIAVEDNRLVVAMSDPANVVALDDIRSVAGREVRPVVSSKDAIFATIDRLHRLDEEIEDVTAIGIDEDGSVVGQTSDEAEDAPVVKLVNLLISQAVQERASDIHVEPTEREVRVRIRVDGVLHEMMRVHRKVHANLVARLKIMSELDISERRVPQDGRISLRINGKRIDLRVSSMPTVFGEKIVMRVLDNSSGLLRLEDLGFLPENLARYEQAYKLPYGTILVTGPTGSGKSTTLYSTLSRINDSTRNVVTVEDPVEYRIEGISQLQINKRVGLTFDTALRSILRQDPDVVLVGETRDKETAHIAMEAALTGHLVLTTLHTSDAASAPTRLVEMGLAPSLVSSSIDCVVAQRLVRRLCDRCKEPDPVAAAEWEQAGYGVEVDSVTLFRPAGCASCGRTGYRGRRAVHEVLLMSDEIGAAIARRATREEIAHISREQGMMTLREGGLHLAATGETSLQEVHRVVA